MEVINLLLDLELFAFDTIEFLNNFVSFLAFFAVGSLVVLNTLGDIVDAIAFVYVHAEWTQWASIGFLIITEASIDECKLSEGYKTKH